MALDNVDVSKNAQDFDSWKSYLNSRIDNMKAPELDDEGNDKAEFDVMKGWNYNKNEDLYYIKNQVEELLTNDLKSQSVATTLNVNNKTLVINVVINDDIINLDTINDYHGFKGETGSEDFIHGVVDYVEGIIETMKSDNYDVNYDVIDFPGMKKRQLVIKIVSKNMPKQKDYKFNEFNGEV